MNTSLIRRAFPLLALTLGLGCASQAATVTFVGTPTGVNDGAFFVTPYQITIDTHDGNGPITQLVTCYDTLDEVSNGDTWEANLLSLTEASNSGYFSTSTTPDALTGYKEVAWLSSQTYGNSNQQIALQHAIWNVFGTAPDNLNPDQQTYYDTYRNDAATEIASDFGGLNFDNFVFIEALGGVAGAPGTKQALVFGGFPSQSNSVPEAPEPGTWAMILSGVALVVASRRRFSRN